MFDFIPHIDNQGYSDTFINGMGAIISYNPISDLKKVSGEAVGFLAKHGWTINRKGLPVDAMKDNNCFFVFKKDYSLVLLNPRLGENVGYILSVLKETFSLLSNIGIKDVSLYWRVDDLFKFKETIDVESKSSEIKTYLLSGKLLEGEDKYDLIENNVSLRVEFTKKNDDNSCILSVYAMTVSMVAISKAVETFCNIVDLVTRARFFSLSEDILQKIKRKG